MSKLEEQQIEALKKINELREIQKDVQLNGIHNPHGIQLLEINELELKEELEEEMKTTYLSILEKKLDEIKKAADSLFESSQPQSNHLLEENPNE
ncbi:MAG: hypothetical protein WC121_14230 [Candidatus Kapaibacterium sp.]